MPSLIVPAAEPLSPAVRRARPGAAEGSGTLWTPPPTEVASAPPQRDRLDPEALHPALWRGHQLGRHAEVGVASGFPELDLQLPGGGWPRRAVSELLLSHLGVGEIRLVAPALAGVQKAGRLVMLFDPPALLSGWALAEMGLDVEQLLLIQAAPHVPAVPTADIPEAAGPAPLRPVAVQARLWALEQALKSGHVGAVLAWLPPRLAPDRVRRLQLAAQSHDGPAFLFREAAAQGQPSAAPLRLSLRAGGVDHLAVNVLKRRGPPLMQPLHLRLPPLLSPAATRCARPADAPPVTASPDTTPASTPQLSPATFINLA